MRKDGRAADDDDSQPDQKEILTTVSKWIPSRKFPTILPGLGVFDIALATTIP